MFKTDPDQRLSRWSEFRKTLDLSNNPLDDVAKFWQNAPLIPYHSKIDPYYSRQWPTPWEIVYDNQYDDFTLSLMIGWTLLLTEKFKTAKIEIKTLVDDTAKRLYNIVCVNDQWALNFVDGEPIALDKVPSLYRLENLVPLERPR
jgi:hypothetical protein